MAKITMYMDGKIPITVDEEEFEIVKLMVVDAGADQDDTKVRGVIKDLIAQGFATGRAINLVVLACSSLIGQK